MTTSLYVAWRGGDENRGRWGVVGRLDRINSGGFRFHYTKGARTLERFNPFAGMNDLETVYESDKLFPLFANRLLAESRPEYAIFLTWIGLDLKSPPDPIAILGLTEGKRATDSVELFPCPIKDDNGCYLSKFFLHGLRWFPAPAIKRLTALQSSDHLALMLDVQNPHDDFAVAVRTTDLKDRYMIGYVPRYLARDVFELCNRCGLDSVQLQVERVNADAPLQQRLLCRMSACWQDDFHPCSQEEFQPIVAEVAAAS